MSYPPTTLLQARDYVHAHTDLPYASLGIVGDPSHTSGYHLGGDRTPPGDYSTAGARDRAGLTNAAAALDIGSFPRLVQLTAWMVGEARAGRRSDTREIIGPSTNGRAYRWARENGWAGVIRPRGDSHEFHVHESFYRDSEFHDKIKYYRGFFEETDVTPLQANQLEATNAHTAALAHGWETVKTTWAGNPNADEPQWAVLELKQLRADVDDLQARPPVAPAPVDPASMKAALMDPDVMAAYAKAINDDAARRQAE